ncbi:MAG: hypothetical protein COT88_02050 [Candidatus Colwellbacteria bacterium CG10_big_fil_rev_8_21_14_0_10_41_28]|uniref:Protein containing YHS domain protein n=1 Tax=Candidatus Colwellbacteria bacterium CG10_big_fil_rev_8_21_14_0_10_41_28 TaxID=1974539 RepID=A0A2H0VGX7_9BACT|nr:MAG: hypothetical protein COT88_02050 [Candidatus Colwellbacteria bacterium CG10_big_fil_rev_8_21_14_0_10_41_28]
MLGDQANIKICVSGAAETEHCGDGAMEKATALGKAIAENGCILTEGATTGFPYWSAKAAKEAGGIVIGFSPAATESEHLNEYKLPLDYRDLIVYTGFGYSGRNLILTRASDAVIVGCGRIGTINEFTVAFEDSKPIGILKAVWETDEVFEQIIQKSHRADEMKDRIVIEEDPKVLVEKIIEVVKKTREESGASDAKHNTK